MNSEKKMVAIGLIAVLVIGFFIFNTGGSDEAIAGEAIQTGSNGGISVADGRGLIDVGNSFIDNLEVDPEVVERWGGVVLGDEEVCLDESNNCFELANQGQEAYEDKAEALAQVLRDLYPNQLEAISVGLAEEYEDCEKEADEAYDQCERAFQQCMGNQ